MLLFNMSLLTSIITKLCNIFSLLKVSYHSPPLAFNNLEDLF